MIIRAFAFLDMKVGAYSQPFWCHHPAQAARIAAELAGDPATTPGRYPSDFSLCQVGAFDDNTGSMIDVPTENLGLLSSFLVRPVAQPHFFNAKEEEAA